MLYCIGDKLLPPRKTREGKRDCSVQVVARNLDTYVLLKGQAGRTEEGHGNVCGLAHWWTITMAKPKGQEEIASVCVTSP